MAEHGVIIVGNTSAGPAKGQLMIIADGSLFFEVQDLPNFLSKIPHPTTQTMGDVSHPRFWNAGFVLGLGNYLHGNNITCSAVTLKGHQCGNSPSATFNSHIRCLESLALSVAAKSQRLEDASAASVRHLHWDQADRIESNWRTAILRYANRQPAPSAFGSRAGGTSSAQTGATKAKAEQATHQGGLTWEDYFNLKRENSTLKTSLEASRKSLSDLQQQYNRLFEQNFATQTRLGNTDEALERMTKELEALKVSQKREKEKTEKVRWEAAWKRYEDGWLEVQQSAGSLIEENIPWPTKMGTLVSTNEGSVREFFKMAPPGGNGTKAGSGSRKILKRELLRWHSDKAHYAKVKLSRSASKGVEMMARLIIVLYDEGK